MAPSSSIQGVGKEMLGVPPPPVLAAYTVFVSSAVMMYYLVANSAYSSVFTLAGMLQCLAFGLLNVQVEMTGSFIGISAKSLVLDALALCLKLSSTLIEEGYLPTDASGDWLYQAVDLFSLALVFQLLYKFLRHGDASHSEDQNSLPIIPIVIACLMLAALFHSDMNEWPLLDTTWMAGLLVGSIAVLPQLRLISRGGGCVETLTSHYIAAMATSRAVSGIFLWHARYDFSCAEWITGFNHAIWMVLGAHVFQFLLISEFGYYYIRAMISDGLTARLDLRSDCCV